MKRWIRKLFRYPAVDGYMMFCYLMAFTVLMISVSMFEADWRLQEDASKYAYVSTYYVSAESEDRIGAWKTDVNASLKVDDFIVSMQTEKRSISVAAEVFLNETERPGYLTKPIGTGEVAIGAGIANMLGVSGGDTVNVNTEKYRVSEVLHSDKSDFLDAFVLFDYKTLGPDLKAVMENEPVWSFVISTNRDDAYHCFTQMVQSAKTTQPDITLRGEYGTKDKTALRNRDEAYRYALLYVFALLNCVVTADLWGHVRKKEITVKISQGYSVKQLFADLLLQSIRLSGTVAVLCWALQYISFRFGISFLGIPLQMRTRDGLILLAFVGITSFISILSLLFRLRKTVAQQMTTIG